MTEIINFGGSVSTEAGQYVHLDTDAAISGDDTLLSITVSLVDFAGISINDFLEVKHVGGITLRSESDQTQILYDGQPIGHIGSNGAGGELSLHFDGYGPAVTSESVTAALRAIAYVNTSSATPAAEERTIRIELAYGNSNTPTVVAVDKTVLVRPDNAIALTSGATSFVGTAGDDIFVLSSSTALTSASLIGDDGSDALHFVGGGSLNLKNFSGFVGIEALRGSAEADEFQLHDGHLLGLSEITGGQEDDVADKIALSGNYFDFRGKILKGIDTIELLSGTDPVFVFDLSSLGFLFNAAGECKIQLTGYSGSAIFRLSGHQLGGATLSPAQKHALVAAGFAATDIYDGSNTPSTGGPVATGLDGDTVGVAPGATTPLDQAQDFSLAAEDGIRKVRISMADSLAGDLLGIQTGSGLVLEDGLQQGGRIHLGPASGILTIVQPDRIEVTFLDNGDVASATALVRAVTYTRPAGDTFEPRDVQVFVLDDFDRSSASTITIVDGVPREM